MASIYKKKRSPFWYIEYIDGHGNRKNESTKLRRDDPEQTRDARSLEHTKSAAELKNPLSSGGEGWNWVTAFLEIKYSNPDSEKTLTRMKSCWFCLRAYLRVRGVLIPRTLTREDCLDYLPWRKSTEARAEGLRACQHNTVVLELKALSTIMREAVSRKMAPANPVLQLGIKRVRGKIKACITENEVPIIQTGLDRDTSKHVDALRKSWKIAMAQGCRISETWVNVDDVDISEMIITFRAKGGRDHSAGLNPSLVPMFKDLKKCGAKKPFALPPSFPRTWMNFFHRVGLDHLSFHCTRVTVVTKLREKKVDPRVARDFVGHSSIIVHRIYERGRKVEQDAATTALSWPSQTGSEKSGSETSSGGNDSPSSDSRTAVDTHPPSLPPSYIAPKSGRGRPRKKQPAQ